MNNYKFILLSLLITGQAVAISKTFDAAHKEVSECQGRVNRLESEIKAKDKEIERLSRRLSRVAGNAEYAADITKYNKATRDAIEKRAQLGTKLGTAVGELKQKIAQVGRRHYINAQEGRFQVVPRDQVEMPQFDAPRIRN